MSTQSQPTLAPRPGFWSSVGIVARREIVVRFLSKSFIIGTAVTLLIMLGLMVFLPRMDSLFADEEGMPVAATAEYVATLEATGTYEVTEVPDVDAAKRAVKAEEVEAAVVPAALGDGARVLALTDVPENLVALLSTQPEVLLLDPFAPNPAITYLIAVGFGIVWMMSAVTFGMSIANSVVEEKQTRIVEILLATVSSRALLTGKIIGNSIAALTQILLIVGVAFLGMAINGDALPTANLTWPIVWFVVLFLVGFVMIAALYAAAAALVSRTEDLANVQQPIMWLVMLPYLAVIMLNGNDTALTVMSYIPFSAPVAIPMRVFTEQIAVWEPFLSLAILVATTTLITMLAARIYRNGLLRTGKPLKWREGLMQEA
ncbi:ABC transporter permease [uncultured Tessaracoccus sp.]|uniref:ABC transporter permease n=1 Tax=uncultured Tessaracoccus sp. TaxID=905023 RepID=UPI0025DEC995|nr:ABC transporter permease [uncultured Tessaracoccus sp.]